MMWKNPFGVLALLLSCLMAPAAGSAQSMPPEVKSVTLRFFRLMETAQTDLSAALDRATQPEQVAQALNAYVERIEPYLRQQAGLEQKYPDYYAAMKQRGEDAGSGDPDVDRAQAAFDAKGDAVDVSMMKIIRHIGHPDVQAAMARFHQTMAILGDVGDDDDDDDDW